MEEFALTYVQFLDTLSAYANRIAPALGVPDGLAFGGTAERIEYPLRTFRVVQNINKAKPIPPKEKRKATNDEKLTLSLVNASNKYKNPRKEPEKKID